MAKTELEQIADQSVQSRQLGDRVAGVPLLLLFAQSGTLLSPWWSKQRDSELRKFWRAEDHLAGAIYTMESRLKTIPWRIRPYDISVKSHVSLAEDYTRILMEMSDYGAGWGTFYSKFTEDLITQDNGAFSEIIGDGDPEGPIQGKPYGIAHLDSWRCQRTSNWEFPVMYTNLDGKRYKMHYTRVMLTAQQPSPMEEMYGVGFCGVSRVFNVAQNLLDISVYKQEKLGSRPHRGIIVTQGGLDPEDVEQAFVVAESRMTNQLLQRYSRTVVVGHENLPDAGMQLIDLASLPDGFDEESSMTMGMAAIALGLGMDPRELWPAITGGVTRAEALIAHIKQRGKGVGEILQQTESLINQKVLPETLFFEFDFQDDEQDRQKAEIKNQRARYYSVLLELGALDSRTVREQQLTDGDLSQEQFDRLERRDGRLPDGTPLLSLLFDPDYDDLFTFDVPDPLDKFMNDKSLMMEMIGYMKNDIMGGLIGGSASEKNKRMLALAALDELGRYYEGETEVVQGQETEPAIETGDGEEEIDVDFDLPEADAIDEFTDDDLTLREMSTYERTMKAIRDATRRIVGRT